MKNRFWLTMMLTALVLSSIFYAGCTKKKYYELNARLSSDEVTHAIISEIDLRAVQTHGTFKSLEAEIPNLKKLGITIISLTPIFPIGELNRTGVSGSPDAIKDFYSVNSDFGTFEDFRSLVTAIHQQGLKILLDIVVTQAAWDSQILLEHSEWFMHNEEGAMLAPDSVRNDVAQIDLNQHELRKYMIAMMKFWVWDVDIDGFRCKSANLVPTDFWETARRELEKKKPVILISDGRLPEHHIKAFDMTSSWDMSQTIINITNLHSPASCIEDSLAMEFNAFPKGSLHLRFIGPSGRTLEYSDTIEKINPQFNILNAVLAFTLPGVPILFNAAVPEDERERAQYEKIIRQVVQFRLNHPSLQSGKYENIQNSNNSRVASFLRFTDGDSVLMVISFAHEGTNVEIPLPVSESKAWRDQFSGVPVKVENSKLMITLKPMQYVMLVPSSEKGMQ